MAGCARCSVANLVVKYGASHVIEIPDNHPHSSGIFEICVELTGNRRKKSRGEGRAGARKSEVVYAINKKRYVYVLGVLSENHSHDEDCMFKSPPARLPITGYPTRLPADTPIQTIKPNKPKPNEETQMWKQVKRDTQDRHARWHRQNRDAMEASGITYEDKGETLLFRNPSKPSCDFYLSTGRWKINDGKGTMRRGGAKAFIAWYTKAAT